MTVFEDAAGEGLIIAGSFTVLDGAGRLIQDIARWDGNSWSSVGEPGDVRSIVAFDDGGGPALIAAGVFDRALPPAEWSIRRWKDGSWGPIGSLQYGDVRSVAIVEHQGAKSLVALGVDLPASGVRTSAAVWDGATWRPLGDNRSRFGAIESFRGELYAWATASQPLYRLEGEKWAAVAELPRGVRALQRYHDDGVEYLYLGGAGGAPVGRFDGAGFEVVESGLESDAIGFAVAEEDGKSVLYAMSQLMTRRYDGTAWTTVGATDHGFNSDGAVLASKFGGVDTLFVGGTFTSMDGAAMGSISAFRSGSWTPLAQAAPPQITAIVESPHAGDDTIYVGGSSLYNRAGEALGSAAVLRGGEAVALSAELNSAPSVLAFHDDGAGMALYAGGSFDFDGMRSAVARWDEDHWRHVGEGLAAEWWAGRAFALFSFDDGSGHALYAGGEFIRSGETEVLNIARWNGSAWAPVGDGLPLSVLNFSAAEVDGERRLLAGTSSQEPWIPEAALWYWNSAEWTPFPSGLTGRISAFAHREGSGGPELLVAGWAEQPTLGPLLVGSYDGETWQAPGRELVARMSLTLRSGRSIGMLEVFGRDDEAMILSHTTSLRLDLHSGESIKNVCILDNEGWRDPGADNVILASARSDDGSFVIGGKLTSFGGVNFIGPARLRVNSCYADCDRSGALDFFDFLCFQNEFAAGAPGADCDGSGELDFFDFLCFQNAFAAGCL